MPRRRVEPTAASLLGTWTDCDTTMQIVGTSLGLFGAGLLEPAAVLEAETPLRNALFDVLLSLVEGGALEMRPADDGRYAFRWRADYAIAALSDETSATVDVDAPSPYLAELTRVKRERDDALGRADFAEALAEERERLLRLANAPVPHPHSAVRPAPRESLAGLDPETQSVLDVLYTSRRPDGPPVPEVPVAAQPQPVTVDRAAPHPDEAEEHGTSEVVYLTPPEPADGVEDDDAASRRPKWSGYTLDKPRAHLATMEHLADEA